MAAGAALTTAFPRPGNMSKGGLGKWFGERWTDVKTGKPCGRSESEKGSRPYPACRPAATAARMSSSEKAANAARKKGSDRISWTRTPGGKKKD